MIDLDDTAELSECTWIRVLVDFYDFLFETATEMCAAHWKEKALHNWRDGSDWYEQSIQMIEQRWPTAEDAWKEFVA